LNLTIIAHDIPYPPTHGGRVDMWRRIEAFLDHDVRVQIFCWAYPEDGKAKINDKRIADYTVIPLARSFSFRITKLPYIAGYPYGMAVRAVTGRMLDSLMKKAQTFAPDIIWLDGLSGFLLADALAYGLHKPLVYRSHNVEHLYIAGLKKVATTIRGRIALGLMGYNLRRHEFAAMSRAAAVYDISCDDAEYWKKRNVRNIYWLPPLADRDFAVRQDDPKKKKYDLLYLGNLHLYNNLAGIRWFIAKVLPLIKAKKPDIRFLIAGRKPCAAMRSLCAQNDIELHADPVDAFEVLSLAKVLINPAVTGSGVSIKTIDMMTVSKHVVTTPTGVIGLSGELKAQVRVADKENDFALQVLDCLASNDYGIPDMDIRRLLGADRIASVIEQLSGFI